MTDLILIFLLSTYYTLKNLETVLTNKKQLYILSAVTMVRSGVWIICTTIGVVALVKEDLYILAVYIISNAIGKLIATRFFDINFIEGKISSDKG
jgi:hypothetical protein